MKDDEREMELRMQRFEQVCRDAHVKLTPQRVAVFREVVQSEEHPDAEAVHRGVRKSMAGVSLDTVYRTLWLLRDLGLIDTLGPPRERTRFEANLRPHHHFVCIHCGLIRDFYSKDLEKLRLPAPARSFGRVNEIHVEARGTCRSCARSRATGANISKRRGRENHDGRKQVSRNG